MAGALHLGNVKPWVKAAAEKVRDEFGITNIGGWRAQGSVPNSDHPKGLALDNMIKDKEQGDAVAKWFQDNAKALGVKYLIWNRKIWHPGGEWEPYSGPSPHTDHVHASFKSSPPKGGDITSANDGSVTGLGEGGLIGGVHAIARGVSNVSKSLTTIGKFADVLTKLALPTTMVRAAAGFAGVALVGGGLIILAREATKK